MRNPGEAPFWIHFLAYSEIVNGRYYKYLTILNASTSLSILLEQYGQKRSLLNPVLQYLSNSPFNNFYEG